MHHSATDNIRTCLRRHVLGDATLGTRQQLAMLEVASAAPSGSYRAIVESLDVTYTVCGPVGGEDIDCVFETTDHLPFSDHTFDVVIAGWGVEQSLTFATTWLDMVRVCRPEGVIIVVAPTASPSAPSPSATSPSATSATGTHPGDHCRLLPGALVDMADAAGVHLVDSWVDPRGPWHNLVGVFRPTLPATPPDLSAIPTSFPAEIESLQNEWPTDAPTEVERGRGHEYYLPVLERVHTWLAPRSYLEIGLSTGQSMRLASCAAIGIDPDPHPTQPFGPNHTVVTHTSDDVFAFTDIAQRAGPFDLAFIDGMHLAEFVVMDFMNTERHCHAASVILIDDPCPAHPLQAERTRVTQFWTGDVWKIIPILHRLRPDLLTLVIDTDPTATLMVIGADPHNNVLWDNFDLVVDQAINDPATVDDAIVQRTGAIHPGDPLLRKVLTMLAHARTADDPAAAVAHVRRVIDGAMPRTVAPS